MVRPVRDDAGRISGLVGVSEDVGARRVAEEQRRRIASPATSPTADPSIKVSRRRDARSRRTNLQEGVVCAVPGDVDEPDEDAVG
jgi:hypothetical protein